MRLEIRGTRKLDNEELHYLYLLPDIIVVKSEMMEW
jgi:hypothetical protein